MKEFRNSRVLKGIAFALGLITVWIFLQEGLFLYFDHNIKRIREFYSEERNTLDAVFIGASEVYTGFAPGYAYDRCGFTSYMYAMESNQGSLYKSQMKEVLAYQDPGIVFVEVCGFLSAKDETLFEEARLRILTQSMPWSQNKLETILRHPYEDKLSCIFPLIKYHGDLGVAKARLSYVLKSLIAGKTGSIKGATTRTIVFDQYLEREDVKIKKPTRISEMSKYYLLDFMDYCKSVGYENVVFVNFPRCLSMDDDLLQRVEEVKQIVKQSGYTFLDLQENKGEIGYDFYTDFQDSHHMNIYGQLKLTDYLGNWLIEQYKLKPIIQTEKNKVRWDECVQYTKEYIALAEQGIREGKDIWINEMSDSWRFREK